MKMGMRMIKSLYWSIFHRKEPTQRRNTRTKKKGKKGHFGFCALPIKFITKSCSISVINYAKSLFIINCVEP
jgi:hypothetical protein